jgi:hypothetical protein
MASRRSFRVQPFKLSVDLVAATGLEPVLPKAGMQILSLRNNDFTKFLRGHTFFPRAQKPLCHKRK